MSQFSASEARANLFKLIDQAAESHEPIRINGKRNNAVLLAESDWSAIQETLFLLYPTSTILAGQRQLKWPVAGDCCG
jgi:prevent-host-death family protein